MSTNLYAFPSESTSKCDLGMTTREYFAIRILAECVPAMGESLEHRNSALQFAVNMAEALIEELAKRREQP